MQHLFRKGRASPEMEKCPIPKTDQTARSLSHQCLAASVDGTPCAAWGRQGNLHGARAGNMRCANPSRIPGVRTLSR